MRFADFFAAGAKKPVYSFEVFPPKNDAGMDALVKTLPDLLAIKPAFMTVTYGAGGSTRSRTLEIARLLQKQYKIETAHHLTCVGSSRAELDQILEQIHAAGIRNLVALRGDPPKGETEFKAAADGLKYGSEMVAHIRGWEKRTGKEPFGLAVGGYPEKHVEAVSLDVDLQHLKHKLDQGADVVVTQLFYDNADFHQFVEKCRAAGIKAPIIPGLLPVLTGKQVKRIAQLCGAKIPAKLQAGLDAAGDDDARAEAVGVEWCANQARELVERGAPGIHFYVLNRSAHISRIFQTLPR